MEATTACHGISLINHTLQYYITYIPWQGIFDLNYKGFTYNSYTMATRDLADIYTQSPRVYQ